MSARAVGGHAPSSSSFVIANLARPEPPGDVAVDVVDIAFQIRRATPKPSAIGAATADDDRNILGFDLRQQ